MHDQPPHPLLLGVDVGGTFTDAVLMRDGAIFAAKWPTTPNQADGVIAAIDLVLDAAAEPASAVTRFGHGTTVATNALLERRGARVAAVFSECCADVLELGRQERPHLHHLQQPRPSPLVPHELVVRARERIGPHSVRTALTPAAVRDVITRLSALQVQAVAICLLHSFRDPSHEQMIAAAIREQLPGIHVVASSELARIKREFERASTTVIDAYLTPVLAPYLTRLAEATIDRGLPEPVVMQSNGGLDEWRQVATHAARAVLSGPAGGLVASRRIGDMLGIDNILCMDVGGTSCDVAMISAQSIARAPDRTVAGLPLQLDMVDIHTIGAGGSSVAWVDAGGALNVGPRSAGSVPGPASYGRGGTELTVTDAHLLLGHIEVDGLARWGVQLDRSLATMAARSLEIGGETDVAEAVLALATTHMVEAARAVSVARGHAPDQLALLAFGGAGALHACDVADGLGCTTVLVPAAAGVLSAAGLAIGDLQRERARSIDVVHDEHGEPLVGEEVLVWAAQAAAELERDMAKFDGEPRITVASDMRFARQTHTLPIEVPLGDATSSAVYDAMTVGVDQFRSHHQRTFGFVLAEDSVVTATIRVIARIDGSDTHPGIPHGVSEDLSLITRIVHAADTRACSAIDLPHGTCLIPSPWRLDRVEAGCLVLHREVEA